MKIFIDTADIDEIKEAISWGIVDGVTTNPSLIKKAMGKIKERDVAMGLYIQEILKAAGNKSVSLEVIGLTADDMVGGGVNLYHLFEDNKNIAIKVPVNSAKSHDEKAQYEGLKAIYGLFNLSIPVNATLIMTPEQALLAAKAGAKYVSPFAGRIDDLLRERYKTAFSDKELDKVAYYPAEGKLHNNLVLNDNGIVSGVDLVKKTVEIFDLYGLKTEIIAASIRNARQARELALTGVDIATIPFNVLREMVGHEKTYGGVIAFENDVVPEYRKLFG